MSRKLSLATFALCATLFAMPVMAQQPEAKDSAKTTTTMAKSKHHAKRHKKGATTKTEAKPAAKDTTKK